MKTQFEITMTIEVEDVGGIKASSGVLSNSVIKAVENISDGTVVRVVESHVSQKTFPTNPIDNLHEEECECCGEDPNCSECDGSGTKLI